jgi:hypothetical protein
MVYARDLTARIGSLFAAALLSGCSPGSPYESTATELSQTEHAAPRVAFSKTWKPVSRDLSAALSEDENVRGKFWLDSCVSELSARFTPAPGETVRALQIAECMSVRGWHLVVSESNLER